MSTPPLSSKEMLAYVQAAAPLAGIPMDVARAARVAAHLSRTAAMAALLEAVTLGPDDEPVSLYDPAPPAADRP